MSYGYTQIQHSVLDGTLMGKYPAGIVFILLLVEADMFGNANVRPELLAFKSGLPLTDILKGIEHLMLPDPDSQSKQKEGRRIELIDPERNWGWNIITFGAHQEKARLMNKNTISTESGANAKRMRDSRAAAPKTEEPAKISDWVKPSASVIEWINTDAPESTFISSARRYLKTQGTISPKTLSAIENDAGYLKLQESRIDYGHENPSRERHPTLAGRDSSGALWDEQEQKTNETQAEPTKEGPAPFTNGLPF